MQSIEIMTGPSKSVDVIAKLNIHQILYHHFALVTLLEVFDKDDYQQGHTITDWCRNPFLDFSSPINHGMIINTPIVLGKLGTTARGGCIEKSRIENLKISSK